MTDTSPYPRRSIAAVVAALAGSVGAVAISFAMIQSAISGQALNPSSVYATSTVGAPTVNATTTNATTGNITTLVGTTVSSTNIGTLLYSTLNGLLLNATTASSTNLVIGQGTATDWHKRTTATINPDSLSADGVATSSAITLTGASAGDTVILTRDSAWAGQDVLIHGYISSPNVLTINFVNASSSAIDLASGTVGIDVWSY